MIVKEWPPEQTIRDLPFIETAGRSVTYAEFEDVVRRKAGGCAGAIAPGTLVGIRADSTVDAVTSMFAVARVGGVLLPTAPQLTDVETDALRERFGAIMLEPSDGNPLPPHETDPERDFAVFATSGSTGYPKGVVLTWGNLVAAAGASAEFLGHRQGDRWLAVLPLSHVGGFSILTRSMYVGGTVILERRFDPERAASLLHDVEFASFVPTMLQRILPYVKRPHERLRAVLVGGGPIPDGLLERANRAGIPAVATYGATETAAQIATGRPGQRGVTPLPGVSLAIEDGEIVVDGPMVSRGYWGEALRTGAYRTGDAGSLDSDGTLNVHGRIDDLVVTGGENVYPAEIESVLLAHPDVEDVVVDGVDDEEWGRVLRATVVAPRLNEMTLAAWARERLAGYKVPKRWEFLIRIPRADLGKPKRSAL